ncbi:MAG: hydrolase 1, exosortase A system-associated [Pseudomonadota bacterium]
MSVASISEFPVVFECQGASLVGIVHRIADVQRTGILCVIAGGPQYRAGVGRSMVSMARELSAAGIPVMRFDHRGLGDSDGTFRGFEYLEEDLEAAAACFLQQVPELEAIVLWGGCDAASGAMISGWKVPSVASMVLGNPWVTSEETQLAVMRQHYFRRLGEWSFWRKLLSLEYNVKDYAVAVWRKLTGRLQGLSVTVEQAQGESNGDYVPRMLEGLQRFDGPVLFLMSGQSLVSKEFDEMVSHSAAWQAACGRPGNERIDIAEADQTFSEGNSRARVNDALRSWLERIDRQPQKN